MTKKQRKIRKYRFEAICAHSNVLASQDLSGKLKDLLMIWASQGKSVLTSIRLENSGSMTLYVTQMIQTGQKLTGTDFKISEE